MRCRRHRARRRQRRRTRDDSEVDFRARRWCAHDSSPALMAHGKRAPAPKSGGTLTIDLSLARRMPAEWEKHEATWIAWPHHEPDWPGKLAPIPWVYAEIVRALSDYDRVEILCHDESVAENARTLLAAHGVKPGRYGIAPRCERSRLAPRLGADGNGARRWSASSSSTGDSTAGRSTTTIKKTRRSESELERITGLPRIVPKRPDNGETSDTRGRRRSR